MNIPIQIPLEVCQNSKILNISDPVLDTTLKVPMHITFKYTLFSLYRIKYLIYQWS